MESGKNAPPMYPNCHCATAPHYDDKSFYEWLDARQSGKTELGLNDWKKQGNSSLLLKLDLQSFAIKYQTIYLPKKEYAKVMSEINTWVKEKDVVKGEIYRKNISNYAYEFRYIDFNEYEFYSKKVIVLEDDDDI